MVKKFLLASTFCCAASLFAGTIILKDGDRLSGVKIISIEESKITVEKDKTSRTFPISKLKGYYDTDLKDDGGSVEELADYKISTIKVDMPDNIKGKEKEKKKDSENAVISYRITRVGENSKVDRVKAPYFYLYILFSGDEEYGHRPVVAYSYPKDAKPKTSGNSKNYDKAAILAAVGNFKRPTIYMENRDNGKFEDSKVIISLKNAPTRKILAWHLEVYGNSDLIYEKTEKTLEAKVNNNEWWKNY